MSLQIRPVASRRELLTFIKLPWRLYQNDPAWVPPLIRERQGFLNPKKNPFFEHADVRLFLATRDGTPVGRISAQINSLSNEIHREKAGCFGLFESENEPQVAASLFEAAERWLKGKGMERVRGPFSFSINEECGLLVKGHEHPPFILMGHNPPFYSGLLERSGYRKAKDLFCWRYDSKRPVPEGPLQIAQEVRKYPGLKIREVDPRHLERDVRILLEVFNSAWANNWGFVPLTESEVRKAAKDFKLILEPKLALIAEVDGKPAAISLALPNLNEAIRDLKGRLFPAGIFKLLYRIKRRKIRSARLMLLGIKKEYRGSLLGGLSVLLYVEKHRRSQELGHWGGELSWTLEDNEKINAGIEFMGGEHYKTYRIYEKEF